MPEHAGRSPADAVVAFLRSCELLLALDNYEHVLDAAGVVAAILAGAPRVRVLVTNRIPLQLYGECEVAVAPLDLPAPETTEVERLTQYDAVKLFIERAQAARAGFEVTSANAPAVAEICARLDGLLLALELATARLKLFSPDALLAQLAASGRLPVLTGGAQPAGMPADHPQHDCLEFQPAQRCGTGSVCAAGSVRWRVDAGGGGDGGSREG